MCLAECLPLFNITVDQKKSCLKWSGFAINSCFFVKVEQLDSALPDITANAFSIGNKTTAITKPGHQWVALRNCSGGYLKPWGTGGELQGLPEVIPLFSELAVPFCFLLNSCWPPVSVGSSSRTQNLKVLGLVFVFVCYHLWSFKNMSMCNLRRGLEKIKAHFHEPSMSLTLHLPLWVLNHWLNLDHSLWLHFL